MKCSHGPFTFCAMHTKVLFSPSMCYCNYIVDPPMTDLPPIDLIDSIPKKCSIFSPCKYDGLNENAMTNHPDCGESDVGTSICSPNR